MLKSTKQVADTLEYPCLLEGNSGNVYLMRSRYKGTVVWVHPDSRYIVGDPVTFAGNEPFKVFQGTISLG